MGMNSFLVDDQLLEFTDEQLAGLCIGDGNEGMVYRYGDEALKIYNVHCGKRRMEEEDAIRLSKVNTSRLLLPRKIIRNPNNGEFLGYTTKFIAKSSITGIIRMKMPEFIDELDTINDDIILLSNQNFDLDDFNLDNTAFSSGIYFVDPGSYTSKSNKRYVRSFNSYNFNEYVKDEIFGMVRTTKAERDIIADMFDEYDYIGDTIRATALEKESVRQYVKRITN